MGISLQPDPTLPVDPTKPKPPAAAPGVGLAPMSTPAPLANEYPNAPSTTGTPQNRLQLATTAFDTLAKSTAPQYTADLREATQKAAGAGNIGSGQLRTTYGNLANQRALSLDTARSNLVNAATTGTIADQQAAEANALGKYNAETGRIGTTGGLDVSKGSLELAKAHEATASGQNQQQIDLAKKTADINAQFQAGTLTLAQKNQALAELQNTQQFGLEGQKLALATAAQDVASKVQLGQLSIAQAQAALDEKVRNGQLTVEQAKLALDQINSEASNKVNQQQANTAQAGQEATAKNQAAQLQLAKEQLDQTGKQFGLSLAQQKELATLADKTQNRQLDISSAQGQNSLLLELARIMGAKDQNSIDPNFLAAIAKSLGFALPSGGATGGTGGALPVQKRADGSTIKPTDPDWQDPTKLRAE